MLRGGDRGTAKQAPQRSAASRSSASQSKVKAPRETTACESARSGVRGRTAAWRRCAIRRELRAEGVELEGVDVSERRNGGGERVGQRPAPRPRLHDDAPVVQLQLRHDERDVLEEQDLCAVGERARPQRGRQAQQEQPPALAGRDLSSSTVRGKWRMRGEWKKEWDMSVCEKVQK